MGDFKIAYEKEEPNNFGMAFFVSLTILLLIVIFVGSYYIFTSILSDDLNSKQLTVKYKQINQLKSDQDLKLNELKLNSNGSVKVPIDVGIQHVIKTYN